jgi:D-alanyl-lipoteichoic acid acyltransferase DltB (MBOAT superfamily)
MYFIPIYILILAGTIVIDYFAGILIENSQGSKRKSYLIISLFANILVLAVFKYYNFFIENVELLLTQLGLETRLHYLTILLPVGLSFHTFQAMSYTIEVYRGNQKAEKHFGIYALYVMFFPQLVAGPIERPQNILHQFRLKFDFNYERFMQGFTQMLWGFFIKVCIADRLAIYVNAVYGNVDKHNGTTLAFATVLFAIQIYCDFSGYSSIAIGSAKIMGYDLMENFRRPYFSKSISEFWGRWHISLSTWFRDYLYIPLGGNRVSFLGHLRNLFITFLISGIWHGANWTFLIWGGLHAIFLVLAVIRNKYFKSVFSNKLFGKLNTIFNILFTCLLVVFAWIFFRADNLSDALNIVNKIFYEHGSLFLNKTELSYAIPALLVLFLKEFKDEYNYKIKLLSSSNLFIKYVSIALIIYSIILFGVVDSNQFIYFQF